MSAENSPKPGRDTFKSRCQSIDENTIALVTGANKGIGYAVCELMVARGWTVLMGCRDKSRGIEAVAKLTKAHNLPDGRLFLLEMDVSKESSVAAAAAVVKDKFQHLDVLVNNAAVAAKGNAFSADLVTWTLDTNYYGLLHVDKYFLSLMRTNGRIVNVASEMGLVALSKMKAELRTEFLKSTLTIGELTGLVELFKTCVQNGNSKEMGWPETMYGVSKAAVIALTRIQARDNNVPGLCINAAHPGFVKTDMSSNNPAGIDPLKGGEFVMSAVLCGHQTSGQYFHLGHVKPVY